MKAERWQAFLKTYTRMGVSRGKPQVEQVLENKHGIDNPVEDLDIGRRGAITGNVTFDGSAITNPPVTVIIQNQNGVMVLQEDVTLAPQLIPYPNAQGVLVQDSDLKFDGTFFYAPSIKNAALTSGRVVFSGAAGVLTDDADLTFDGTTLSSQQLKAVSLTSGRVVYVSTGGLLVDDSSMTFDGTSLTVDQVKASNLTPGRVVFAGASGLLTDDGDLTFDGNTLATKQLQVGGGAIATRILQATATLNFPSTNAQTSSELTIAVTGAAVGDVVMLGTPAAPDADSCFTAYVSATDVVTVRFNNYSAAPINPASGDYRVAVLQF